MLRGAELVRVAEDIGGKLSFHDCTLHPHPQGARTVSCQMRGTNCTESANCQDKKTNETGVFYLSPVFVTLARNLGAFAKTSDDSGFSAGGSSQGKAARRL